MNMESVWCADILMEMKEIKNIKIQKADNKPTKAEIRTHYQGKRSEVKIADLCKPGWLSKNTL